MLTGRNEPRRRGDLTDRPRIRQSFKHRKLVLVAGGLFLLSGVAFAIAKLEPGAPQAGWYR